MASIVIDFGSTNSGAALNAFDRDGYDHSKIVYVNSCPEKDTAKEQTCFWIRRDLLERDYAQLSDSDFRILSKNLSTEQDPNVIWTRDAIKNYCHLFTNNWVKFERFKMYLYDSRNLIKDNHGSTYDTIKIIKLFLRTIKVECLEYFKKDRELSGLDIKWGVTIPAVWETKQKDIMRSIVKEVLSEDAVLLSEPEGALIGVYLHGNNEIHFQKGRTTLVIDAGGGTTDIVLVKEEEKAENVFKFVEVKGSTGRAKGGNEVDNLFWTYFVNILKKDSTDPTIINGEPCSLLWLDYKNDPTVNLRDIMEMEDNWFKLKHSEFEKRNDLISMPIHQSYGKWLMRKGYTSIAQKIMNNYGTLVFDGEDMRQKVFLPVYNAIADKVEEVVKGCGIDINKFIFAGGLSCDSLLTNILQTRINKYHPAADKIFTNPLWASGAIQYGATHIMSQGDSLIDRIARRTYYTDYALEFEGRPDKEELLERIRAVIQKKNYLLGNYIDSQTLRDAIMKSLDYMDINFRNNTVLYLLPICIKGKPAYKPHVESFSPVGENQTKVQFSIYSSDENMLIFPNDKKLKLEDDITHDFGYSWKNARVVVDFNASPISGVARFTLYDENDREIKYTDISNVTAKGL